MDFKVLCSDLDGTLLTTKSDVSQLTINEIARIKANMRIVLVSARMPNAMRYIQQDLGILHEPIICYNGAYILDGEREIASVEIAQDHLEKVFEFSEPLNISLGLYHKDEWYVEKTSERVEKEIRYTKSTPQFRATKSTILDWKQRQIGAHKIMLMGTKESSDTVFPILEKVLGDVLNLYRSNDTLIEIAPKSVSKLTAIKKILKADESLNEVIAFGDNYNDMEMLKAVGKGVAVANAREEVKEIAGAVALANAEDGVAHFIRQYLI